MWRRHTSKTKLRVFLFFFVYYKSNFLLFFGAIGAVLLIYSNGCGHIRPKLFFSGRVCLQGKGHLAP